MKELGQIIDYFAERRRRLKPMVGGWNADEVSVIDRFYPEGAGTEIELFNHENLARRPDLKVMQPTSETDGPGPDQAA